MELALVAGFTPAGDPQFPGGIGPLLVQQGERFQQAIELLLGMQPGEEQKSGGAIGAVTAY